MALVLGGGTAQGLWSDHLLELLMIPAAVSGYSNLFGNRLGALSRLFVVGVIVVLGFQFFPFNFNSTLGDTVAGFAQLTFWSGSLSGSAESVLFAGSVLGFSLFVASMNARMQEQLIRFVFLGLIINIVVGVVQLSFGSRAATVGVLPFDISSGLFANENHFSSLIFATIPLLAWRCMDDEWHPMVFVGLVLAIVLFSFSVGSHAGMGISMVLAVFCLVWRLSSNLIGRVRYGLIFAFLGVGLLLAYAMSGEFSGDLRFGIFENTLVAIQSHWVTGTGLGTFVFIYPSIERSEEVLAYFVNHAHNDYLELFLEGGLAMLALILVFVFQIVRFKRRTKIAEAATVSVIALMAHSLIDYPMRTMAIAVVFGLLVAIILTNYIEKPKNSGAEFE